jgi:hypothetical protein
LAGQQVGDFNRGRRTLNPIAALGALVVVGIVALAIRDLPLARREGLPWRGKLLIWVSGLLLALTLILIRPVNGWLSWVLGIGCGFGLSNGVAVARREESTWRDRARDV